MVLDIEELKLLVNQQSREAAEDRRRHEEQVKVKVQEDAKRHEERMKKTNDLIASFRQQRQLLELQQQPEPTSRVPASSNHGSKLDSNHDDSGSIFPAKHDTVPVEVSVIVSSSVANTGDEDSSSSSISLVQPEAPCMRKLQSTPPLSQHPNGVDSNRPRVILGPGSKNMGVCKH